MGGAGIPKKIVLFLGSLISVLVSGPDSWLGWSGLPATKSGLLLQAWRQGSQASPVSPASH